jgi:hypothetical protein
MKNRKREICTSGPVRDEDGNILIYSANDRGDRGNVGIISKPDPRLDPTRPPDRNPDELVWKHLKADTVGRMAITDKADFHTKVRASMRQLQNDTEKIRSFYQKPSLKYAA